MLTVAYEKEIPYPYAVVLSQYYDYEHIAHVHPRTLGEYRLMPSSPGRLVYEQLWPAGLTGRRAHSTVVHAWSNPGAMTFDFVAGRFKGVRVRTRLDARGAATVVAEAYEIPLLPNWAWLARLVRPLVLAFVNRVWDEDLQVEVCRDGWPGVPASFGASRGGESRDAESGGCNPAAASFVAGPVEAFLLGQPRVVRVDADDVLIVREAHQWTALSNRCPHAGGPMVNGRTSEGAITCPWHGARFDLRTGAPLNAVTSCHLPVYDVTVSEGMLVVTPRSSEERR